MKHTIRIAMALCTFAIAPVALANDPVCKAIHADMTEVRFTTGCDAGEPSCFLGEVQGNHGFIGTTHFRATSVGVAPVDGAEFTPYAGGFRYELQDGDLFIREAGLTGAGRVTAHHTITGGTGAYVGAIGTLYVFGTTGPVVTTEVVGTLCTAQ